MAAGVALALAACSGATPAATTSPSASANAATPAASRALQHALDRSRDASSTPGAQAAFFRNGQLFWSGSSGLAITDPRTRVRPATLFSIASATKTYTAALTLLLVEEGSLKLSDTVGAWLGDAVIRAARSTTVRRLLRHTSGLPDYVYFPQLADAFEDPEHVWTEGELLDAVRAPRRVGRYEYSNTNYVLLGSILTRASDTPIPELLDRLILQPLDLDDTFIEADDALLPRWAHGYDTSVRPPRDTFEGASGVPSAMWGPLFTDGAIATTAIDLARFTDALYLGRLLEPATLETMLEPGPDASYGMGTYVYSDAGRRFQGHDGSYGGFSSNAFTDISAGLTLSVIANDDDAANAIWEALMRAYRRLP